MKNINLLVLIGSQRKGSFNQSLAKHIQGLMPEGITWVAPNIFELPFYNEDLMAANTNPHVREYHELCRKADAVLIVSPEYNWSIPGVIKNAIDWGTRPWPTSPIGKKPVFLSGASSGPMGTGRMHLALRQVFGCTKNYFLENGDVLVSFAHKKFDAQGLLTDEDTKSQVKKNIDTFVAGLQSQK